MWFVFPGVRSPSVLQSGTPRILDLFSRPPVEFHFLKEPVNMDFDTSL